MSGRVSVALMELVLRLKRLFSLSSYPPWLAWLPSESPGLGTAFLAWRKRVLCAFLVPFVLLALFVLLARLSPSSKPAQFAFAVAILAIWPLCLLPISAWSFRLALLTIAVLRSAPSSGGARPGGRLRLRSFAALLLVLAAIGAVAVVPWILVVYQLAPAWLAHARA